jgi:hypothetical protein
LALTLALGMIGLLASNPALAQTDESPDQSELSQDWSVRIGVFMAQSQAVRSKVGDIGISGLVDRRIYAGNNYEISAGIGYNGLNDVYSVPIVLDLTALSGNIRYGAGTGYAFGKRLDGRGTSGPLLSLLVGYQLTRSTNPLSLDLRYYFISGSSNELDGYSFTLGYKF